MKFIFGDTRKRDVLRVLKSTMSPFLAVNLKSPPVASLPSTVTLTSMKSMSCLEAGSSSRETANIRFSPATLSMSRPMIFTSLRTRVINRSGFYV